jgi:hypothetical protein
MKAVDLIHRRAGVPADPAQAPSSNGGLSAQRLVISKPHREGINRI